MLKTRIIPILLLRNGLLVRSQFFKYHQFIGHPEAQVDRYKKWDIDELILLDISERFKNDYSDEKVDAISILKNISKNCFIPITFGGGIRTIQHIYDRLSNGADKISINTQAILEPAFVSKAASEFGSQAIVVSIDVRKNLTGEYEVFSHGAQQPTGKKPKEWAKQIENLGAGEILLNSVDRDGSGVGYDLQLIQEVSDNISIPLVCCGGAKDLHDFHKLIITNASGAAAAGNLFHFKELSYIFVKNALRDLKANVR